MKPVLEIQHLSKAYKIRHESAHYRTLRESILNAFRKRTDVLEDFLALDDVSMKVNAGESLGIVGRNGAGKSTLLKLISRIVAPDKGRIVSRGRIGSLLEVGTGFHPELTGRENIFFNGSLLGMSRKEIEEKFEAIVDFSGVEKFLDTELKHYSSGMQLRLAFSVAAFLETEIIIIDEVLAVGDAEFQKKCMMKMEDVHQSGRTILFVSHNMAAVQKLCKRAVILQNGTLAFDGPSTDAISQYTASFKSGNEDTKPSVIKFENSIVQRVDILCDGKQGLSPYMGCKFEIFVSFKCQTPLDYPVLGLIFRDRFGFPLIAINNKHYVGNVAMRPVNAGVVCMTIPYLTLFAGEYVIDLHFGNAFRDLEVHTDCIEIKVEPMSFTVSGELPDRQFNRMFIQEVLWKLRPNDACAEENSE